MRSQASAGTGSNTHTRPVTSTGTISDASTGSKTVTISNPGTKPNSNSSAASNDL